MKQTGQAERRGAAAVRRRAFATAAAAVMGFAAASSLAVEEQAFLVDTTADLARLCGAAPESPFYAAAIHMCQGYILGVHLYRPRFVRHPFAPMRRSVGCPSGRA